MRSRTSITDSLAMSHPDRGEEHGKNAVEHNHQENRLDHRVGGFFAERFGAALHLQAFNAGDDPDHQRHERGLDHSHLERRARDRLAQPRQENFGLNAAVEPRKVRTGTAMTRARMRGRIRTSTGSNPIVRNASISSRMRMAPNSAV